MLKTPSQADKLDNQAAISPQIQRILRKRIIQNLIEPGTKISETEIATEFGVSRQPVREAFIKLSEESLLQIRPQRGTFVCKIEVGAVMDARFLREAIEADIASFLAANADTNIVENLRSQIADQKRVSHNHRKFLELDDVFHASLAHSAGKARVWKVVEGLKSQMDRVRHLTAPAYPISKLIDQHEKIVDAIAHNDAETAAQAMRQHLRNMLHDLPELALKRSEYFELDGD